MISILQQIEQYLIRNNQALAVAESCTGGQLAVAVTSIAGSSKWFAGGVVAYTIPLKEKLLGVKAETINKYGVVSAEVATEMALGIKQKTNAGLAISTTGIAGPTGGDANNPIGTVWVGVAYGKHCWVHCFHFSGSRLAVQARATEEAFSFALVCVNKAVTLRG